MNQARRLEERPWWPDLVALKDVLSLRELGARFGAAPAAIANALRRNNMDRAAAPPGPRSTRDPEWRRHSEEAVAAFDAAAVVPDLQSADTANDEVAFIPPAASVRAWRVTVNGQPYVVVGRDISAAIQVGIAAGRGTVDAVELLGQALV